MPGDDTVTVSHRLADFLPAPLACTVTAAGFLVFTPGRSDYAGHYLAGFGGAAILGAVIIAFSKRPPGWPAVAAVGLAIALGAILEATVFRIALFDPEDFANQSLGACVALAVIVGRAPSQLRALSLALVAPVALVAGAVLALH